MKVRCVNIRFFLLISAFLLISHSMHSTSYADITPVSDRTSQVRDAIVAAVPNIDTAADVTETHLATITSLNLRAKSISALKSGDFSGLTGLTDLNLYGNQLSNLPNGIFEGLTALTTLRLGGNTVDPMPITVSLKKLGDNQFKAAAPTGAPFDIVIPISATNGSISDNATSITIAKGSTESNVVTVSRTADTTAAVTANIGTLPSLPQNHYGYTLSKSSALPVEIISEVVTTTPVVPEPIVPDPVVPDPIEPEPSTNTAPVFTDGVNTIRTIAENTAANINISSAVTATDADDNTLTYSLSSTDASSFSINSTSGQLSTKTTLDYETKSVYIVTVTVSDGNLTDTITVVISIIDVAETTFVSTTLAVSNRTAQVQNAIVAAIPGVSLANEVTDTHLATITALDLRGAGISELKSGDFSGLTALINLNLYNNMLSSLPSGIFDGLTALTTLRLGGNLVDPMPLIVSLQQVADNQFQAVIPVGAPFDVVVLVGAMMITIPQGSVESDTFTADASVTLGALPSLPANHFGYILAKSAVCNRTSQVADAIAAAVPGVSNCHNVTEVDLATITSLNLSSMSITSLKTGDFAGMLSLTTLNLSGNQLTSLPDGIFADLASLVEVNLSGNSVSPLPLSVSLQKVGSNQIKAVMPTGAPFDIVLPLAVANGSLSGGTALTIPTGSVESSTQTITRTSGTTAAVTVDISSLPNLPSSHSGYALAKSNQRPLEIFKRINVAPVFTEGTTATRTIAENTTAGTNIGSAVSATDANNDTLTYRLSGIDAVSFSIVSTSGQLKTKATLDYETKTSYSVTITVSDGNLTDTISVTINITDIDENRSPVFSDGESTTRSVDENTGSGVNIGTAVSATDADDDTLTYTLSGTDAASFSIVSTSGQLQTKSALDYETKTSYSVIITVSDGSLTDTISVTINVTDVDETPNVTDVDETPAVTTKDNEKPNNAPVFKDGTSTTRAVAENTGFGVNIGSAVSATDADEDTLTYSLGGTDVSLFSIDGSSGQLRTRTSLDYETKDSYSVTITVSDGAGGSDSISVTINITNIDESAPNNAPVFTDGERTTRTVAENTASGVDIGSAVSATDADDDTLSYSLGGTDESSFSIDSSSGQLRTSATLDYEAKNAYSVTITVSDGKGGSDSISVTINVTDVDETPSNNAPVFASDSTTRTVAENTATDTNIGSAITATDADDDSLTYSISGTDSTSFSFVNTSGQLKTKDALNHETKSSYAVTISVSDGKGGSDSISVTINVTNVNEAPVFADDTTTRAIAENVGANINIGTAVKAADPDTDDSLTYTLGGTNAASFAIDDKTGQLKTKEALDFETKSSYSVTVTAKDAGNLTDSISVTINVTNLDETPSNIAPIFDDGDSTTRSIAENTPADRNIGAAVSATDTDSNTLAYVLGGDDASSFSIDLNTGQLKTSGALDHETKSSYTVTVEVSDGSLKDTIDVTISVTDVNEAPVFTIGSRTRTIAENAAAGTNIGDAFTATDQDNRTLEYTLGGDDAASFDIGSTTGQLKTKAALDYETETSYSVTITASDGKKSDSITVTITVMDVDENRAPAFDSESTTRSVEENTGSGVNIGGAVSATDADDDTLEYTLGGADAASFDIGSTNGQLRTKASLDYETKTSYSVTITVKDGNGGSDSISVTINITEVNENRAPIVVSAISADTLTAGDSSVQIDVSGNFEDPDDDTLTYTASSDDTSVATVSVSGSLVTITPEGTGDATITVTASDGELTATQTFSVSVDADKPGVSITVPSGVENDEFDVTIIFTEPVSDFEQSDVSFTGTAGVTITEWFANTEKTVFTATLKPTKSGKMTLKVGEGVATDAANNPNTASAAQQIEIDITQPDVSISVDLQNDPRSRYVVVNRAFDATITFTEAVSGFEQADVWADCDSDSDITITGFEVVDAMTYTVEVSPGAPEASDREDVTIVVRSGVATDAAGNPNTRGESVEVLFEFSRPAPTITVIDDDTDASKFRARIGFRSEYMLGFDQSDLSLANSTASATITSWSSQRETVEQTLFQPYSAVFYYAEITATTSGIVRLSIAENVATDLAGNGNTTATPVNVTITIPGSDPPDPPNTDTTSPSVSISVDLQNDPRSRYVVVNRAFDATITFTEAVSGFEQADVWADCDSDSDITITGFEMVDAMTYTVEVSPGAPQASDREDVTIVVRSGVATDAAGNPNTRGESVEVLFEFSRPAPTITVIDDDTDASKFRARIGFRSEYMLGFDQSDLSLANSTASATITSWSSQRETVEQTLFQPYSAVFYYAEITATTSGVVRLSIAENVATDLAGNGNTAATPVNVTITIPGSDPPETSNLDTTSPSVSISVDLQNDPRSRYVVVNRAFDATITFTEAVSGFEQADVWADCDSDSDITITGFEVVDAMTYTVEVSPGAPEASDREDVTIVVQSGVATDAAGNPNTRGESAEVLFEFSRPAPTITVIDDDTDASKFRARIGFRSEYMLGFDQSDLSLANSTASATITSWSSQRETVEQTLFQPYSAVFYYAEITATTSGVVRLSIAENVATDLAGNGNTAAVQKTVTITLPDNQNAAPLAGGDKTGFVMDPAALKTLDRDALEVQLEILRVKSDGSPKYLRTLRLIKDILATMRPNKTKLLVNYPNPFNPETWIPYHLANPSNVRISIYNMQGVVVRRLELGHQQAGYYTSRNLAAYWDGTNDVGESVTSGVYFYQLQADNRSYLRKMVILK